MKYFMLITQCATKYIQGIVTQIKRSIPDLRSIKHQPLENCSGKSHEHSLCCCWISCSFDVYPLTTVLLQIKQSFAWTRWIVFYLFHPINYLFTQTKVKTENLIAHFMFIKKYSLDCQKASERLLCQHEKTLIKLFLFSSWSDADSKSKRFVQTKCVWGPTATWRGDP